MKRKVKIRPIFNGSHITNIALSGDYKAKDGKVYRLLSEGRLTSAQEQSGERTRKVIFSKTNPELTIVFDDDENEVRFDRGRDAYKFYSKHPQIKVHGTDNSHNYQNIEPLFELIDMTKITVAQAGWINDKREVVNYLVQLSDDELRDVAYRYGEDPRDKTHEELIVLLGDYNTGRLMMCDEKENMPQKFMADEQSQDKELVTIARKAIAENVITEKDGMYSILGTAVGRTFNDVVLYCKSNTKEYESFIVPQVAEKQPDIKKGRKKKEEA